MKYLILSLILTSTTLSAQVASLSPEEQKNLAEEVQVLKNKVQALEGQSGSAEDQEKANRMMETIRKGSAFQAEQQQALEELDQDM